MKTTGTNNTSSLGPHARRRKAKTSVLEVIVPIEKAAEFLKLGRSSVYRLTREGRLKKVQLDNRTWILFRSIDELKEARGVKL